MTELLQRRRKRRARARQVRFMVVVGGLLLIAFACVAIVVALKAKREGWHATDQGQDLLGEWTQAAGPGTMHVEFRADGTTKSWLSLTKDQLTSTGKLMKAGTIMPDSNGKPLFIEGWWKRMDDGRLMIQTDRDSTELPKDFTQEMSKWSKKK